MTRALLDNGSAILAALGLDVNRIQKATIQLGYGHPPFLEVTMLTGEVTQDAVIAEVKKFKLVPLEDGEVL